MGIKSQKQQVFSSVYQCSSEGREKQTVVSDLDGTLLRGSSSFPYFMLLAFEASGVVRFASLLLLSPLAWFLYHMVSEAAAVKLMVFVSCAGVREADIASVARAVLPKFYVEDVHPETWRVFSSFGKRFILTANPRIMIEPFAKEYLAVDGVIGSELHITQSGRATGFLKSPGVMVGANKEAALHLQFGADALPDVGLGDRPSDYLFLATCKEGYVVPRDLKVQALPQSKIPKPMIFHDGRLVKSPTPLWALIVLIWLPIGFILALIRVAVGVLLPTNLMYYALRSLGVRVIVKGTPPLSVKKGGKHGVLFVCTHKTLLDPLFVSCAIGRPVSAVTYSLSRVSEVISPIRTVRLSRDRERDAVNIRKLLEEGDLVICPEGTTCREPFLLRFSALFAELADRIVPVAMNNRMSMFHATTARGWKGMDFFYYFMNPSPIYEVTFLDELPKELTCSGGGHTPYEVANYIQRILADTLKFECTSFTRKDKYKALAGNDGTISPPPCDLPPGLPKSSSIKPMLRMVNQLLQQAHWSPWRFS